MSEVSGVSSTSSPSSQSAEQKSTSGASSASASASGSSQVSSSQSTRSSNQKESKDAASFSESLTQSAPTEEAESLVQNTISVITHNDAKGSSSDDEASSGNETSAEKRETTKASGETQPATTTQSGAANDTSVSASDAFTVDNTAWYEEALEWSKETASDIGDVAEDVWDWSAETSSSAGSAIGEFDRDNGAVLTRGAGVLQGTFGAVEAAGGVIIAGVGTGTSLTGVGAPVGVPAAVGGSLLIGNGIDNFVTGFQTAWTGEFQSTILAQASGDVARLAGASPETARNIENTVDIGSGFFSGGVAATVKTTSRMGVREISEVVAKADVAPNNASEFLSFINNSSRASHAGGINLFKDGKLRAEMANSTYGQRVLQAADSGEINLTFSTSPGGSLDGRSYGNQATVYLENTQHGYTYDLLGVRADGYQFSAGVGIHEGLHSLGVAGSRRAEALVRLAELDNLGVTIDSRAMRQVLTDMGSRRDGTYSGLPWRSGDSTPNFPELEF